VAAFEPVLSRNWNVPDSHTLPVYESRGGYQAARKALTTMSPDEVAGFSFCTPFNGLIPRSSTEPSLSTVLAPESPAALAGE